jgi:arsenate reductase (thioredoxin)
MKVQMSIVIGIASALLGLSTMLQQTVEPAAPQGAGQAALSAVHGRRYFFLLFHKEGDAAKLTVWQTLKAAVAKWPGQVMAVNIRVNDPAMKAVVDRYGVGRSPLPLVLAVTPDGAVMRRFDLKLKEQDIADVLLSPGQAAYMKLEEKQQKREVLSIMGPMRRVLFVCVENSNRSQMAEAFARSHGGGRVEAYSAGSRPSGRINPRAVQFMREIGYDLAAQQSKSLDRFNGTDVDVAVTMGCGDACPLVRAGRHEEWSIPDPKELPDEEFRKVRDLIERKVKELLAGL